MTSRDQSTRRTDGKFPPSPAPSAELHPIDPELDEELYVEELPSRRDIAFALAWETLTTGITRQGDGERTANEVDLREAARVVQRAGILTLRYDVESQADGSAEPRVFQPVDDMGPQEFQEFVATMRSHHENLGRNR